jgi:glycosyl hydrolase family 25/putative peptidoglycan binding protein
MKYATGGVTGTLGEALLVEVPLQGKKQDSPQQDPQPQGQQDPQQQSAPPHDIRPEDLVGVDTAFGQNGDVDWNDVTNYYGYVIAKAGQHTYKDKGHPAYWDAIGKTKLIRGGYHFWQCNNDDGPEQAKALKKLMSDIRPGVDLPPCLDLEFSEKSGKPALEKIGAAEAMRRFGKYWQAVADQFGVYPMIYTSGRVWHEDLGDPALPIKEMIHAPIWCKGGGGKNKAGKISGGYIAYGKGVTLDDAKARLARSSPDIPNPKPWGSRNYWIKQYGGDLEAKACHFGNKGDLDLNHFQLLGDDTSEKSGERVKWVQRRLKVSVTGNWDGPTIDAVKKYQQGNGLAVRGIVDPWTFVKLAWEKPSSDGL